MACCKCCCGGENCTEGQEGKCCCGGVTGACCQVGEYCCDGVCEPDPCAACEGTCGVVAETVWYSNLTGSYLVHDGDSYPVCSAISDLPEVISGAFTLGTSDGCAGVSCGCELQFRFWRNLFSTCNGGSSGDITTETVVVSCTGGTVVVHAGGSDYTLDSGDSHTFSQIGFDTANGSVPSSTSGDCFSVEASTTTASFSVEATLDWAGGTDHDLYGSVSCGAC